MADAGPRGALVAALVAAALVAPRPAVAGDVVSETETTPHPGIRLVSRVESSPNNRIQVAFVDLCADSVHVTATQAPTSRRTPGSWGAAEGVQLATNGDFYTGVQVYGDAVGGGMPWPLAQTGNSQSGAWYYERYGWIAFGDDWVEFNHTERTKLNDAAKFGISLGWKPGEVTSALPSGTRALVSGFPELVIEGQVYTCSSPTDSSCFPDRTDMRARHPRTAMGLTEDRRTFILAVVDGRNSPTSVGMYGAELAELMGDLGAYQAFNLDGGGSSAMWVEGQGYVNNPSDGSPRAVANHWGIFAGPGNGQPTNPGNCFVPGGCYATPLPGAENEVFKDMPPGSAGFAHAIALANAGITNGCSSDPKMFCPSCKITRAQAVTFLVRAAGLDTSSPPSTPTFTDVPTGHLFFAPIEAAAAAGITTGCTATTFCPDDLVTRAQLAAFVRRTLGWPQIDPPTARFGDVPPSHLHYRDIETIAEHCVASGCGDGTNFCPDSNASRSVAARFIAKAFDLEGLNPCDDPDGGTGQGGASGSGAGGASGSGAGGAPGGSGGSSVGGAGQWPDAGGGTSQGGPGNQTRVLGDDGGCGCRVASPERGRAALWLLAPLALLARRYFRFAATWSQLRSLSQKTSRYVSRLLR